MNKKLFIVSLGCPKNLVDSEVMLGVLQRAGYSVCHSPEEASVILVNTCGFIQPAVEEALDEILQLIELKKSDPDKIIAVTGCLVQRYGKALKNELPEVELFIGTDGFISIDRQLAAVAAQRDKQQLFLGAPSYLMDSSAPRVISTPPHRAYLKVSEGCSNRCSYCLIPSLRGRLRSRSLEDLIIEAKALGGQGVKELTLVGQDLTAYGIDFGAKGPSLTGLLERLLSATDIPWLRMLYLYPNRIDQRLLELAAANPRLLPYFDIPMQHVSSRVLRLMNRPSASQDYRRLLTDIRRIMPQAAIRTTFIVGFPGEEEEDVRELEEFVREFELDHVGIFAYSNEEGCRAEKLPDHCPDELKEERRQRLMTIQADISMAKNQKMIGLMEPVLVEGISKETELLLEGRTRFQAPEIDGCVYINSGTCGYGDIVNVRITEAHTYDLVGEIL